MIGYTSGRENTYFRAAPRVRLLLLTGLAGAGRTLSLKTLEDLGFEAIDNLPLNLIGRLWNPSTICCKISYRFIKKREKAI